MRLYLLSICLVFFLQTTASATVWYVDANAQGGGNDGNSWANAFTNLQDALTASEYGDTIWVATATYLPTAAPNRYFSFNLKNGVRMFGGFAGHETAISQRDWTANPTYLSGDIGIVGDTSDNSFTVIFASFVDSTTILDGFVVTGGNASSIIPSEPNNGRTKSGGGMYLTSTSTIEDSRPQIINCNFVGNHARQNGGGIYVRSNSDDIVTPYFFNCEFLSNSAKNGGGIYYGFGSSSTAAIFDNCLFESNYAQTGGGIYHSNFDGPKHTYVNNCRFINNSTQLDGGGIFYENFVSIDSAFFNHCDFIENKSEYGVTVGVTIAILNLAFGDFSHVSINACKFIENDGESNGTICGFGYVNVSIDSCKFEGNFNSSVPCFENILGITSVKNTVMSNNKSRLNGIMYGAKKTVQNCTISGNSVQRLNPNAPVALIYAGEPNSVDTLLNISNTIIYDNIVGNSDPHIRGKTTIKNSLFDVPNCSSLSTHPNSIFCGPGNLFATSPLFLDTAAHDYRLHPCSPARNAGSNAAAQAAGLATDIAGLPRIQEGTVDMGAHETPPFAVGSATVTAPPCTVGALASVELALDWGCPPFFLSWAEAAGGSGTGFSDTSLALLQLPSGSYTVTVTDGRTQAATASFTVAPPTPLTATLDATAVQCATGTGPSTGGIATATPLGGTGPFTYSWNGGQTMATATGLPLGQATVTITDANGCTATSSVQIGLVGGLQVGVNIIEPFFCQGEQDGVVQAMPFGGTPPFAYQWEGLPWEQSPTLDSVGPGSYSATVTDALGCTGDVQFNFGEPTAISVSVVVEQPACHGEMGSATATASGGMPGFSYLWDTGGTGMTTMLPPGIHSVTATDVNGCTGTAQLLVTEPPLLTAFVAAQPQTLCFEENNGQLAALPQGGTPPYSYDWGDSLPADSLLTGTGPGNYALTLTDANGCSATASANVAEHLEIIAVLDSIANASGPGIADGGVAIASVSGGTGSGYVFSWSNGSNGQDLVGVASGDHSLTVTDSQGCTANFSFFVDISLSANSAQPNPFGAAIVPNPSGRGTKARVQLSKAGDGLVLSVFDEAGRLVAIGKAEGMAFELPQGLAAGSYRVVLQDGEHKAVLNWVVE